MAKIKALKVDITDRIKNDPDEKMWVITAYSEMSKKCIRMSGGVTKETAETLKKEIESSKEQKKIWKKVKVENLESLGKDVKKSADSIDDVQQIVKTSEHVVKVVADEDQAGIYVDVYIDGKRIVEINAENLTGRVSYPTKELKTKPRVRDSKTGKLK